jgi:hypothetical protein
MAGIGSRMKGSRGTILQCTSTSRSPERLNEPSLGSVGDVHLDQERWAAGGRRDLEQDDGESGIGDQDGLDEQVPFRDWQGVGMV